MRPRPVNPTFLAVLLRLPQTLNPTTTLSQVSALFPGASADASGQVHVGDGLFEVDGSPIAGRSVDEVVSLLRGPDHTFVTVSLETQAVSSGGPRPPPRSLGLYASGQWSNPPGMERLDPLHLFILAPPSHNSRNSLDCWIVQAASSDDDPRLEQSPSPSRRPPRPPPFTTTTPAHHGIPRSPPPRT